MSSPYLLRTGIRRAQTMGALQTRTVQRPRVWYPSFQVNSKAARTIFTVGTAYLFRERLTKLFEILTGAIESPILKEISEPIGSRFNHLGTVFLGIPLLGIVYALTSGAAKGEEKSLVENERRAISQALSSNTTKATDIATFAPELQKKITDFETQIKQSTIDKAATDLEKKLRSVSIDTLRTEAYQLYSQAPNTRYNIQSPSKIYAYQIMNELNKRALKPKQSRNELLTNRKNIYQQWQAVPNENILENQSKKWYYNYQIGLIDKELTRRGPAPKDLTKLQESTLLTEKELWNSNEPFRQPGGSNLCYMYSFLRSLKEQPGGNNFLHSLNIRKATLEGKTGYVITYPPLEDEKESLKLFVSEDDLQGQSDSEKKESLGLQIIRLSYLKHPKCPGIGSTGFATETMRALCGEATETIQSSVPAANSAEGDLGEYGDAKTQVNKLKEFIKQCLKNNQQVMTLSANRFIAETGENASTRQVQASRGGGHYYSVFWDKKGQLFLGDSLDSTGAKRKITVEELVRDYIVEGGVFPIPKTGAAPEPVVTATEPPPSRRWWYRGKSK